LGLESLTSAFSRLNTDERQAFDLTELSTNLDLDSTDVRFKAGIGFPGAKTKLVVSTKGIDASFFYIDTPTGNIKTYSNIIGISGAVNNLGPISDVLSSLGINTPNIPFGASIDVTKEAKKIDEFVKDKKNSIKDFFGVQATATMDANELPNIDKATQSEILNEDEFKKNKSIVENSILNDTYKNQKVISEIKGFPLYFKDLRNNTYIIFRGYIEGLTDNIAPSWNAETYPGKSSPTYIYENTSRDISFTLKLMAHSQKELSSIYKKLNRLVSLCYPEYKIDDGLSMTKSTPQTEIINTGDSGFDTSEIGFEASEDVTVTTTISDKIRMKAPVLKLRIGDVFGTPGSGLIGHLTNINPTFPDESPWEIELGKKVPKFIDVAITYQVMHSEVPGIEVSESGETTQTNFYGYVGDSDA
jgi:hypothetical protein